MKRRKRQKKKRFLLFLFVLCLFFGTAREVWGRETEQEQEIREQEETKEDLLQNLELGEMQEAVNELLGEETFQIRDALERVLSGKELFTKEFVKDLIKEFLSSQFLGNRTVFIQILLLVMAASLFTNFANAFGSGQTGEISFYVVYMLLLAILIHSFGMISSQLADSLRGFIAFMQALMPSYFLAVTASTGAASAMVFYEMALAVIYVVQIILLKGVLPGIHTYVILEMINYLHKEDFLSKMAELLKTILEWTLKTCVAVIIGMQIIQNMIGPAVDSLKRDMIGKTAGALPGIGNAITGATEVALGTAVLIRNCLGVVGIFILLLLGLPPLIRLCVTTLLYKLMAALVQPVSDKRMVGCLSTMGEGCRLLLKVLLTVELLLLITIAILSISFIAH